MASEDFLSQFFTMGFLYERDAERIEALMKTPSNNIEVEFRLGSFRPADRGLRFSPGVSVSDFEHIRRVLRSISTDKSPSFPLEISTSNTKVFHSRDYLKIVNLEDPESEPIFMRKGKIADPIDNPEWGYRIAASREEAIRSDDPDLPSFSEDEYRIRNRTSFVGRIEKDGPLSGVRVDLTIVTHRQRDRDGKLFHRESYEVELERMRNMSARSFFRAVAFLYAIYQRFDGVYLYRYFADPSSIPDVEAADVAERTVSHFISHSERRNVITSFNAHFGSRKDRALIIHKNEPIDVKLDYLFSMQNHAVTAKLDGKRKLLYSRGDQGVFLINPPNEIVKILPRSLIVDSIVDGEFIIAPRGGFEYYAFDSLVYEASNIEDLTFENRIDNARIVMSDLDAFGPEEDFKFSTKSFYVRGRPLGSSSKDAVADPTDGFYESVKRGFDDITSFEKSDRGTDGLILQPMNEPYLNEKTYKWKPPEMLTIDFKIQRVSDERPNEFYLYTTDRTEEEVEEEDVDEVLLRFMEGRTRAGKAERKRKEKTSHLRRFEGTADHPYRDAVALPQGRFLDEIAEGRIIEFKWVDSSFVPMRYRDDKPFPNRTSVAEDVWYDINHPIERSTIRGEDVVLMRRFHDQIKKHLLSKFSKKGLTLLDIGGDPSDIKIWKAIGFSKVAVVGTDRAREINEEKDRTGYLKVEVINASADDRKAVAEKIKAVDDISAFYSLNDYAKDEKTFTGVIDTIGQTLKAEGHVLGFVYDDVRVASELSEGKVQTDAFSIEKQNDWKIVGTGRAEKKPAKSLGNAIKLRIPSENVSETTYLVNFESLAYRFRQIGIDLIAKPLPSTLYNVSEFTRVLKEVKVEEIEDERAKMYYYDHSFIDVGIEGLPSASRELSKLVRIIVFRRREAPKIVKEGLEISGLSRGAAVYETDLLREYVRYATPPGPSNLFAAIKRATAPKKYLQSDENQRIASVLELRNAIADKVTPELFQKLGGGFLARELTSRYANALKISQTEAAAEALKRFRDLIRNPEEIVGDKLEVVQVVSEVMGVNIYLIDSTSSKPYIPQAENRGLSLRQKCELLYDPERKSIILLSLKGVHFEVLAKGNAECISKTKISGACKTLFAEDTDVFRQIREQLCSERIDRFLYANVWKCLKAVIDKEPEDKTRREKVFRIAIGKSDSFERRKIIEDLITLTGEKSSIGSRAKIYDEIVRSLDLPEMLITSYLDYVEGLDIDARLTYLDALRGMNEPQLQKEMYDRFVTPWFTEEEIEDRDILGAHGRPDFRALGREMLTNPKILVFFSNLVIAKASKLSPEKRRAFYLRVLGTAQEDQNSVTVAFLRMMSRKTDAYRERFLAKLLEEGI